MKQGIKTMIIIVLAVIVLGQVVGSSLQEMNLARNYRACLKTLKVGEACAIVDLEYGQGVEKRHSNNRGGLK